MARTLLDDGLKEWEVFATTGRYGAPGQARVMFRCMSEPAERALAAVIDGDTSDAEALVAEGSDGDLKEMMAGAKVLD